jgi:hypothetical protein
LKNCDLCLVTNSKYQKGKATQSCLNIEAEQDIEF